MCGAGFLGRSGLLLGLLLCGGCWCEVFFWRRADEFGKRIVDTEALFVEVVQYIGSLGPSDILARSLECGVGVVEESPKGGGPCVLVRLENLDLFRGSTSVEIRFGVIFELCWGNGGSDDCSPRRCTGPVSSTANERDAFKRPSAR